MCGSPFLKIGVTRAVFISDGNTPVTKDRLKRVQRLSAINGIAIFSMFIGMRSDPQFGLGLKSLVVNSISCVVVDEKKKLSRVGLCRYYPMFLLAEELGIAVANVRQCLRSIH